MPLILTIMTVWLAGGLAALAYQKLRRRPWGEALHLATIFGLFLALLYFIGLLAVDFAS